MSTFQDIQHTYSDADSGEPRTILLKPIPFFVGDSILFKITIKAPNSQLNVLNTSATNILPRSYLYTLKVISG
jgi:hypothetical protein